jgi:hypothetical protein
MGRSLSAGIKLAAQQLSDDKQMCDLRYGTVVNVNPLKIQITNLLTLPQSVLVVPQHLTDHNVNVTVNWNTENTSGGSGENSYASHKHSVNGLKTMTIHNALKVGDKVALIRKTGGQSYYILDRI